jgi:hypothetical protein
VHRPTRLDDLSLIVDELGVGVSRSVIVLIGGTKELKPKLRRQLSIALDRGLAAAASDKGAVILTGGTDAGVISLLGQIAVRRSSVTLIGVAPESKVVFGRTSGGQLLGDQALAEPHHDTFVLTPGQTWGAETEYLFELARLIAQPRQAGIVVLANGGPISRYETKRFLSGGWPVLTLSGTKREADRLASASRKPSYLTDVLRRFPCTYMWDIRAWGDDVPGRDVEVHTVSSPPELLYRKIIWRLTPHSVLKEAWLSYGCFDEAASEAKHKTRMAQYLVFALSFLLVLTSLLAAYYSQGERAIGFIADSRSELHVALVALPIAIVVAQTVADLLVPARAWVVLRQAAELTYGAIMRHRATAATGPGPTGAARRSRPEQPKDPVIEVSPTGQPIPLSAALTQADKLLSEADVSVATLVQTYARPKPLSVAVDEFSALTIATYISTRVDDQLRYYSITARTMKRYQSLTVLVTAFLAAVATGIAVEEGYTIWVPVVVFLASSITVLQQRARWRERIRLMGSASAALRSLRRRVSDGAPADSESHEYGPNRDLSDIVASTEAILEREQMGWSQAVTMGAA